MFKKISESSENEPEQLAQNFNFCIVSMIK